MKYYKNGSDDIFAYALDGSQDSSIPGDLTLITDEEALAIVSPTPSLASVQLISKTEIDRTAEQARLRYITDGAGQSMAYQEKSEEASDYVVAGYPADLTGYPWIQAEVNATAKTATQAADDILVQKSAWIGVGASIEQERLSGKIAVDAAVDEAGVNTARDAAITALDLI